MFKKAKKTQAKLKIGLAGPSGSGKTFAALRIASGMGGKIAVIDTEHNSASLYADKFEFDTMCISSPYTTDKYLEAMKAAEAGGYDILIIDSASHQWAADGGILMRKEQVDSRGGNSFTNWAKFSPEHEKFKAAIVASNMHLICTLRSKQDYIMNENSKGKQTPTKVGLAPVQREGFEYELTVMLDIAMDHTAKASKDRTSMFDCDRIFLPTEDTGKLFMKWLNEGAVAMPIFKLTDADRAEFITKTNALGHSNSSIAAFLNGKKFVDQTEAEWNVLREKFLINTATEFEDEASKLGPISGGSNVSK